MAGEQLVGGLLRAAQRGGDLLERQAAALAVREGDPYGS
jgi:hypothetical protein